MELAGWVGGPLIFWPLMRVCFWPAMSVCVMFLAITLNTHMGKCAITEVASWFRIPSQAHSCVGVGVHWSFMSFAARWVLVDSELKQEHYHQMCKANTITIIHRCNIVSYVSVLISVISRGETIHIVLF